MLNKVRIALKGLLSNVVGNMLANIIVDRVLPYLLSLLGLGAIWIWFQDAVWNLLEAVPKLLSLKSPIWLLLILTLAEGLTFYYLLKVRQNAKPFFFDYERVRWRVNRKTGKIDEHPYCPDHRVQLVWDSNESYYCPLDGERDFPTKWDIGDTRRAAQNIANALLDGFLDEKQMGRGTLSESSQRRILKKLPLDEKALLRTFMLDRKPQRHSFDIGGAPMRLRMKKVLFCPPQTDENGTFSFEITDWAYEMLTKDPDYLR